MFESVIKFFKNLGKKENTKESSDTAKERLHLVLMQDRANVSADFLELMKQEIIEVIKKYIDVDEKAIDVRLTNKANEDGTVGAPALYANIPITTIKNEARKVGPQESKKEEVKPEPKEVAKKATEKEEKKKSSDKEEKKESETKIEEIVEEKKQEKTKDEPKKEKVEKKTKTVEKTSKEDEEKKAKHAKKEVEKVKEPVKKK